MPISDVHYQHHHQAEQEMAQQSFQVTGNTPGVILGSLSSPTGAQRPSRFGRLVVIPAFALPSSSSTHMFTSFIIS